MLGVGEQGVRIGELDDLADIHHRHPVADLAHDAEVVGDEEIAEAELRLQAHQQVDHLGLHRHVEGGHRLVGNHQSWVYRQRTCDADPLSLATAECVGIAAHVLGAKPDQPQQLCHPVGALLRVGHTVDQQRFAYDVQQRHSRVERRERILEHHLHLSPPRPQLAVLERRDVHGLAALCAEQDLAFRRVNGAQNAA